MHVLLFKNLVAVRGDSLVIGMVAVR